MGTWTLWIHIHIHTSFSLSLYIYTYIYIYVHIYIYMSILGNSMAGPSGSCTPSPEAPQRHQTSRGAAADAWEQAALFAIGVVITYIYFLAFLLVYLCFLTVFMEFDRFYLDLRSIQTTGQKTQFIMGYRPSFSAPWGSGTLWLLRGSVRLFLGFFLAFSSLCARLQCLRVYTASTGMLAQTRGVRV